MAAPSPALSNNSSDAPASTTGASSSFLRPDGPPKTLRGLNKPKCIQCGNVARSRCPYHSCKSCCSKAQNPCHIHVLKANATFPEKSQSSSTPLFDQQSTDVTPAVSSLRLASLRQLSSNFSQFNSVQTPFRSKKPLTRKEASAINEWRFSKLKEYKEKNIEVENEAFDRYMQNINLLEDVFSAKSILEATSVDEAIDHSSLEDGTEKMVLGQKLRLRSNPIRSENVLKRMQQITDAGLEKLQRHELNESDHWQNEVDKIPKQGKDSWVEKTSALDDLLDKLSKARNEEDLQSCLEMKVQLYNNQRISGQVEAQGVEEASDQQTARSGVASGKILEGFSHKFYRTTEIDEESLKRIDSHFSSLEKIEDL